MFEVENICVDLKLNLFVLFKNVFKKQTLEILVSVFLVFNAHKI